MIDTTHSDIQSSLSESIHEHFEEQRKNTGVFVRKHFDYPGCWQTNKHAFGLDLIRAPLNLLWAPIYISIVLGLMLFSLLGWKLARKIMKKIPGGLTTKVQNILNQKIREEVLATHLLKDRIENKLLQKGASDESKLSLNDKSALELSKIVDESLQQLMLTRTASADISNTLISALTGAIAFKKFTPGGFGLGIILASLWVRNHAESSFFLGDTLGKVYYRLFPPSPNALETFIGVLLVMVILSVIASFSGLITDPIQARLGLHKRRLNKMLEQMEKDMLERVDNRFNPLDPYIARILELFDTLKSQLSV